jgi:hypothetical protein
MIVETFVRVITFDECDAYQAEQEAKRDLDSELSLGHAIDEELEASLGFRPFGQEW